jgi:predicted dehydrogenase
VTSLRAGLSGCSPASLQLLQRCRAHRECDVVALHDDDEARLAAFRTGTGIGFATTSFEQFLGSGVDFVILGGPLATRADAVRAAATQGAHCLVLAPFASDLASAQAMVAACEQGQVRLGVHVPELEDPVAEQIRRMIGDDWLGGVVALQSVLGDDLALRGDGTPHAHPLAALAARHVQLATWLTGRAVVRVTAQCAPAFGRDGELAVATALLRGGIAATFTATHVAPARAFAVFGTDGAVRLSGERLWLLGRSEFRGQVFDYVRPGEELVLARADLAGTLAQHGPACDLVGRFARWIDDRDDFPGAAEDALAAFRAADAMLRAARDGVAVDVSG